MKIKKYDLSGFSDLGTAVFYPTRTFHFEVQGNNVSNLEKIIEKASSATYLYSTNLNSEYIDFAMYDFRFNLPETKYWSSLLLNSYDYEDTVSKFGKEFDSAYENLVPQIINTKDTEEKHFFGRLLDSENTIFLLHIPREIESISNSLNDPKTVWKVEFYNSRLTSNNTLFQDRFIDYDILSTLGNEYILENPILTVYFGPSWDVHIQDYTLDDVPEDYLSRYTNKVFDNNKCCLTEDIYNSFETFISKSDYIKMTDEEINSEKILYIINTTNGELKTIDMFSAAYIESVLKHRNQNKKILRNDETKDYSVLSKVENLVFDSRSSTLLGIGGSILDCPLLSSKIKDQSYSSSSSPEEITVTRKTYIRPKNQEILGENPEISPYWILKDNYKKSIFNHFYITKTGKGEIEPSGTVTLKSDKLLEITVKPDKGNRFVGIDNVEWESKNGKIIPKNQKSGDKYNFRFDENLYTMKLSFSCDQDYVNFGESNIYSLSDLGINLWYYDYETDKEILYTGGDISFTYSKPLIFRVEPKEDSLYEFSGDYFLQEDSQVTLEKSGDYIILRADNIPESILEKSTKISVIGSCTCKQYHINIETSKEIQVSTAKDITLGYGDGIEIQLYCETGEEIWIEIIGENSDVWKKTIDQDGIVTLSIQERTKDNLDVGIKSNYKIIASI